MCRRPVRSPATASSPNARSWWGFSLVAVATGGVVRVPCCGRWGGRGELPKERARKMEEGEEWGGERQHDSGGRGSREKLYLHKQWVQFHLEAQQEGTEDAAQSLKFNESDPQIRKCRYYSGHRLHRVRSNPTVDVIPGLAKQRWSLNFYGFHVQNMRPKETLVQVREAIIDLKHQNIAVTEQKLFISVPINKLDHC